MKEEPKPKPVIADHGIPITAQIEGMRKWITKVFAVHGSGTADRNTYRVAIKICSVIKDFNQAMAELVAWDQEQSTPPMSDTAQGMKGLEHKVRCARKYLGQ